MADGSIIIDTKIEQSGFKTGHKQLSSGLSDIMKSLKGMAVAAGIAFGVSTITNFAKESIQAATELSNALTGLRSILDGQGRSFGDAQKFIDSYISDGLIPATNAITAYKNLALRGYDDSQIQKVMQALKDSSSYGRAASYSMGQAVESATEGLKNENSILVDNAGVTKNVAKMWDDYAKSIGTTSNNLTQQQKIQAEVSGIMQETRFQVGDAAKVAETYSGQILQLGYNINNLKVAFGNSLIPMARAVLPSINAIILGLTKILNLTAQVSTALFGQQAKGQEKIADTASAAATAQNELAASTKAAATAAKGALAGFDELNILQSDTGAVGSPSDTTGASDPIGKQEIGKEIEVSPQVQVTADRIKAILEPIAKQIDLKNIISSINKLWGALKPLEQNVGEGLFWFFNNVLAPLAVWTINNAVPAYIDTLSAGINLLNAVIESAKPGLDALWNKFLKPIGEWTGGAILSIWEALKNSFKDLAVVFTENSDKISNILSGLSVAFGVLWALLEPILDSLLTLVTDIFGGIASWIADKLDVAIKSFSGFIDFISGVFTGDWDKALQGLKDMFEGYWENIKADLMLAWDIIVSIFENVWRQIKLVFAPLVNWFKTNFNGAYEGIKTAWSGVKSFFSGIWEGIKSTFTGVANWFKNTFTTAWENVKKVFSSGGKIFSGIKEGIADTFKTVVNALISGINVVVSAPFKTINGMLNKIRDVSILGVSPFKKLWDKDPLPIPQIPELARGGIADAPTLAMIGERGKEAVVPLENNTGWMDILAEKLSARLNVTLAGAGGGDIYLDVYIGNEAIDDRIVKVQRKRDIRSNGKGTI